MKIILLNLLLCCFVNSVISYYCYWNTGCPYKYLSSETPYNLVRGDIRDSVVKLEGCEPVSVWGIYRHGKTYPDLTTGRAMKEAVSLRKYIFSSYEKGHSSLCAQDVENLRNWEFDGKMFENKEDITDEGRKEMLFLGKRLREAFPDILNDVQTSTSTFRSANGKWFENSLKEFVKGLGLKNVAIDKPKTGYDDIAPSATSEKSTKNNVVLDVEMSKYLNTSDYLVVKDRIQRRTGIDYVLTDDNVTALYNLCRYTWSGIDGKASPWCALFTKDDLQVLEYEEDLRHFYSNGYGSPVSALLGGVPLADLFGNFEKVKLGEGKKFVSYVTYTDTLEQIYTALGLFKDNSPLTGTQRDPERKWRTSVMSVYSGNFLAVLHRCKSESQEDDYSVVFYMNEEPIRSLCGDGVCSWQELKSKTN
ncbi:multiple inositol polyphosphate phosphatase 1-like [Colias croceus]|uniref:multiple inositol polyphosphate phosphatase 1-like n=1 Tax=Colias crocea TaxID=72248 RepID=UPI001E280B2E|nr:multiple inositol polyphosphate phosphatase 1-like [Colias croceus]